jgi:hypothetical protein
MKRPVVVLLAVLVLLVGIAGPSHAWARGGGGRSHGGGGHFHGGGGQFHSGGRHFHGGHGHFHGRHGHFHGRGRHFHSGGFHHPGCCWGRGVFIGGLALGTALAYPYYAYPYPVYSPPVVVEQPPVVHQQPVQREVVYPNGRYVLYGDGVTQPWQWVWIPADPAVPPAPPTP